jgi:nitrite reductase (NO-forming)
VADVHAQSRRGLLVAAGFVVVAVVAALAHDGWWLPLHLFVVGALLSAISAATQMLAVTWSASPAPSRRVAAAQRWALAAGTVALAFGRETDRTWLFFAGGATVVVAMLALAVILIRIRQQAVTDRFAPAIEAYVAAVSAGAVGMSLGIALGSGWAGARAAELRGTHLVLNVFGLIGLVIAGTLPYFAATQTRSKMSRRATPTAVRITMLGLSAATAVAATGEMLGTRALVAGALIAYALGLLALIPLLPVPDRARLRWAGPRVAQLLAGIGWWASMTIALAVVTIRATNDRQVVLALVVGGFGQILVASLAYLGPVLRGGGHRQLAAGFAITRSWISLAAGNVAALAALTGHERVLAAVLVAWLTDMVVRAGRLLATSRSHDGV